MHAFKESLCSADFWLRLLYTFLFMLVWQGVEILLALLAILRAQKAVDTLVPS